MPDLNFGYNGDVKDDSSNSVKEPITQIDGDDIKVVNTKEETSDITSKAKGNPPVEETSSTTEEEHKENNTEDTNKETTLVAGTKLEIGDKTYTVDNNGNVVDENGVIFKEAKDVAEWIKDFETSEEDKDKELTVQNIARELDLELVDEDGKPIEYENTPEGIKAFISDAIETSKEDVAEATINSLYENFPFVKPMIDYYIANGRSLEGFNEIPDRSNIEINEDDESQQEAIIKTSWRENNRTGNVDSYIAYLKSSGTLAAVAREELQGLKDSDAARKEKLEADAKAAHEAELEKSRAYWQKVESVINSKKIAGYQLPDNIIVERDGKKVSVTLKDFYNYIARNDKDGLTQYARDLMKQSEQDTLEDDILRAYLRFTGGNYSNLVDMAINEQKVKTLKLKAADQRSKGTIRITPPTKQTNQSNIDFGY